MKKYVRAVGIDDAPFKFTQRYAEIFFAVLRAPNYIEGLMRTKVEVDGRDATQKIVERLKASRFFEQLDVIFLDGCTVAGFNVVDIDGLFNATGIPVITVCRKKPDMKEILETLKKKFEDWEERSAMMKKPLLAFQGVKKPVYVGIAGISAEEARLFMKRFTVQGSIPEPLRIAHMIASLFVLGETRGRP